MRAFRTYILFAVCAMVLSAAAARAEGEIAFPELKDAKLVQEDWYASYAEGKKIGYSNVKISEVKFNGEDCLLFEKTEVCEITVGDKTLRRETTGRALVIKGAFSPIYCSSVSTTPVLKLSETARFERKKEGQTVTITTILNDKTATETFDFAKGMDFYAEVGLPYCYAQKMLNNRNNAWFTVFNFTEKAEDMVKYEYKGERTEGEGEKARTFRLVQTGAVTIWYGPEGKIERVMTADNLVADILRDEKTAKNPASKWDGYKAPDCIAGDILTLKSAGIKIKRPAPQYVFITLFENNNVFLMADCTGEMVIVGLFLPGVPKGTEHRQALEKMKGLDEHLEYGRGKLIEVGKHKCLSGTLKRGAGLEAGGGKYYLFIQDDRFLLLMARGKEGEFANAEKDIVKCLEFIEFVEPVYDESKLLVEDKKAGMQLKLPDAGWVAFPGEDGSTTAISNFWRGVEFYVHLTPAKAGDTVDLLVANISEDMNVIDRGDVKVGEYNAKYFTAEETDEDKPIIIRTIVIPREKDFIVLTIYAPKSEWEKALPEIESILKSVKFTEEKPKP